MPGNPLSITLPVTGVTVGPDYADQVTTAIQTIIDDVEQPITPDEIEVNQDQSFRSDGTSHSAVELKSIGFSVQTSAPGPGELLNSIYGLNGELVYRDASGVDVVMTSVGSVAGAAGNISSTGSPPFSTLGVEILWSGGDTEYRFKVGPGADDLANLVASEMHYRNGANTFKVKTLVTTDFSVTWPAAAPAADSMIVLDASGNISFTSTITGTKNFSGSLNAQGGLEVDGTLGANGSIVADGGIVLSGTNAVASAGGKFVHGDRNTAISMAPLEVGTGISLNNGWFFSVTSGTADKVILQLAPGHLHNVKSVTFSYRGAAANRLNLAVKKMTADGTVTTIATGSGTFGAVADTKVVAIPAPEQAFDSTSLYTLEFSRDNGGGDDLTLRSASYDWDNA